MKKGNIFKLAVVVWAKALAIYLGVTIISIAIPFMYFISAGLAILWSIPGLIFLYFITNVCYREKVGKPHIFYLLLILCPIIAFGCTYLAALHFTEGVNTWREYQTYFLFPLAGIISALLSMATTKAKLYTTMYGAGEETDEVLLFLTRTNTAYEN